jgi:hypothetical protein
MMPIDLHADQPAWQPNADNRAISSVSRSDNRSTPHLPIDPTRSKDVMR